MRLMNPITSIMGLFASGRPSADSTMTKDIQTKWRSYPKEVRPKLERLKVLIYETAAQLNDVGEIEETLKWGELAYLTPETLSGSTIRIDWKDKAPHQYAMYFNCKTNLIETFQTLFPNDFTFEGHRAILFNINEEIPEKPLKFCIAMALRYHLEKPSATKLQTHLKTHH